MTTFAVKYFRRKGERRDYNLLFINNSKCIQTEYTLTQFPDAFRKPMSGAQNKWRIKQREIKLLLIPLKSKKYGTKKN